MRPQPHRLRPLAQSLRQATKGRTELNRLPSRRRFQSPATPSHTLLRQTTRRSIAPHLSPTTPSRHASTSRPNFAKAFAYDLTRVIVFGSMMFASVFTIAYAVNHGRLESEFPTPEEWSNWTRFLYRTARGRELPESNDPKVADWGRAFENYKGALERLEDPEKDGAELLELDEGGLFVPGVGRVGFDLQNKSEAWRQGYYEVLLGIAKAAEHLDGFVHDKKHRAYVPEKYVVGPSHPDARPLPPWIRAVPREEDCEVAAPPAEVYYTKILTTAGFTTKQRLDAAVAYAEWLDFKGLHDSAHETYRWALDIACGPLPDADATLERATGVLRARAPLITDNLVTAVTALGVHEAQAGRPSTALAIFLSVLRAIRAAPAAAIPVDRPDAAATTTDVGVFANLFRDLLELLQEKPPAPARSGDDAYARTPETDVVEAALQVYVGEILFASSPSQRHEGLAWTRRGLELAERRAFDEAVDAPLRGRCLDCAQLAVDNLKVMVSAPAPRDAGRAGWWGGWFGRGGTDAQAVEAAASRREHEERELYRLQAKFDRLKDSLDGKLRKSPVLNTFF